MQFKINDDFKKFMFLEDKSYKEQFKEECFRNIRSEIYRHEASFKI